MSNNRHVEVFRATAQGSGWPTKVSILDSKWEFQVDESKEDGGLNNGPNPMHHFVASLAGCQNEQAQVVAEEMEIEAKKIDFTVEVSLNLSGFIGSAENSEGCFEKVNINAEVSGVSAEQAEALGTKVNARCPILSLLRSAGATIESKWVAK